MSTDPKHPVRPDPAGRAVAVCGLYCGACPLWRAHHDGDESFMPPAGAMPGGDTCDGCRSDRRSKYCLHCTFRDCATEKGLATCADCAAMPCERLTAFAADGVAHHAGAIEELAAQRGLGHEAWYAAQRRRWSCPDCRTHFEWYSRTCVSCGRPVPGLRD